MGVFSNEVIPTHVAADVYCGTSVYTEADRNASAYFKKDDLVQVNSAVWTRPLTNSGEVTPT